MPECAEILEHEFEQARLSFFCPPVRGPEIVEDGVCEQSILDWDDLAVRVDGKWAESMTGGGGGEGSQNAGAIIRGMFAHELGHYMIFPRDAKMQTFLSYTARKKFGANANAILSSYIDLMNNIVTLSAGYEPECLASYIKYSIEADINPFTAMLGEIYNRAVFDCANAGADADAKSGTGSGINIRIDYEKAGITDAEKNIITGAAEKICRDLNFVVSEGYLDNAAGLRIFAGHAAAVAALIKVPWYMKLFGGGNDIDRCLRAMSAGMVHGGGVMMSAAELRRRHGKQRLEELIRELCREMSKKEFDEFMDYVENNLRQCGFGGRYGGEEDGGGLWDDDSPGIRGGMSPDGFFTRKKARSKTIDYYIRLAESYGVIVNKKKMPRVVCRKIMMRKRDFKASDPPAKIDLRYSGGKLLPTLAKTARRKIGAEVVEKEAIPNIIIYKDVSGSMPDPAGEKCFGTIAGAIFVLSYLRSGSRVGATLFDSCQPRAEFYDNERDIIKTLCGYGGGGTSLEMDKLEKDMIESEKYSRHLYGGPEAVNSGAIEGSGNGSGNGNGGVRGNSGNSARLKNIIKNCGLKDNKTAAACDYGGNIGRTTDIVIISDSMICNLDELAEFVEKNASVRLMFILTDRSSKENLENAFEKSNDRLKIFVSQTKEDIIEFTHKVIKSNLIG